MARILLACQSACRSSPQFQTRGQLSFPFVNQSMVHAISVTRINLDLIEWTFK